MGLYEKYIKILRQDYLKASDYIALIFTGDIEVVMARQSKFEDCYIVYVHYKGVPLTYKIKDEEFRRVVSMI